MFQRNDAIGPYILLAPLGNGAFGEVWLAEKRTAVAAIKVALKLPNRSAVDLDAVRQEAQVWEQAKGHPNVLPLLDADVYAAAGQDYLCIVSEYVPGGTLQSWLDGNGGRAPTLEAACAMTDGILRGLEHLHTRQPQVIHRDLKPANVLLQDETPRLADFGLARVLKTTEGSATISGTAEYMSPDALDGQRTAATDIWSVGVMLYQMLAGRLPYPQKNEQELMFAIVMREPAPLPQDIPAGLREIVAKALQKDPSQRWPTAAALRQALHAETEAQRRRVIVESIRREEAEEKQRLEAEAQRQREAAEQQQREEAERLRLLAEAQAQQQREAEARQLQEAQERQRREDLARQQQQAEELRRADDEKARRQAEAEERRRVAEREQQRQRLATTAPAFPPSPKPVVEPAEATRRRRFLLPLAAAGALAVGAFGVAQYLDNGPPGQPADNTNNANLSQPLPSVTPPTPTPTPERPAPVAETRPSPRVEQTKPPGQPTATPKPTPPPGTSKPTPPKVSKPTPRPTKRRITAADLMNDRRP